MSQCTFSSLTLIGHATNPISSLTSTSCSTRRTALITLLIYSLEQAPPVKKRKTGPDTAKAAPAEVENGEKVELVEGDEEEDDVEEEEDDEEPESTGPTAKAKQVKGGIVPHDDDLEEVDEVAAADEEDDEE